MFMRFQERKKLQYRQLDTNNLIENIHFEIKYKNMTNLKLKMMISSGWKRDQLIEYPLEVDKNTGLVFLNQSQEFLSMFNNGTKAYIPNGFLFDLY